MTEDPLKRLVIDQAETDRELLATLLEDKVRIDPSRATFSFKANIRGALGVKKLVLTALLARKAISLLARDVGEGLTPKELEVHLGVPGNSLRPALKFLKDHGLAVQQEGSRYSVPQYVLEDAGRFLSDKEV